MPRPAEQREVQGMSQVGKIIVLSAMVLAGLLALASCGDSNPQAPFDPGVGHPENFLPERHALQAASGISTCTECHGEDLGGGISGVACTSCHLGDSTHIHPLAWDGFVYARHGAYVDANGNASCAAAFCHGRALTGVAGSGPSCSSCHLGGVDKIHPAGWDGFAYAVHDVYVEQNGTTACANGACHGPSLTGVAESGPSCTSCHLGGVFSFHPVAWASDFTLHGSYVAQNGSSSCANVVCHGANLQGVVSSGPPCAECHTGF
jgi:hypothetical protein